MHTLKTIWTNWQSISKKIFEGKLGEKIKRGDLYFILLDIFLFIQVFSESQLNEQLFVEDLLFVSRIIVLISVSYTHLDVYKRQRQRSLARSCFFR